MTTLKLTSLTTLETGTVATYRTTPYNDHDAGDRKTKPIYVSYYDANNNGKLDSGDRKNTCHLYLQEPAPKGLRNVEGVVCRTTRVTQEDIDHNGGQVSGDFASGKKQRDQVRGLPELRQGVNEGGCYVPHRKVIDANRNGRIDTQDVKETCDYPRGAVPRHKVGPDGKVCEREKLTHEDVTMLHDGGQGSFSRPGGSIEIASEGKDRTFSTPLALSTVRAQQGYVVQPPPGSVEPQKCDTATAYVESSNPEIPVTAVGAVDVLPTLTLEMDSFAGPALFGLMEDFGLVNSPDKVDVNYYARTIDSYHINHLDIDPNGRQELPPPPPASFEELADKVVAPAPAPVSAPTILSATSCDSAQQSCVDSQNK